MAEKRASIRVVVQEAAEDADAGTAAAAAADELGFGFDWVAEEEQRQQAQAAGESHQRQLGAKKPSLSALTGQPLAEAWSDLPRSRSWNTVAVRSPQQDRLSARHHQTLTAMAADDGGGTAGFSSLRQPSAKARPRLPLGDDRFMSFSSPELGGRGGARGSTAKAPSSPSSWKNTLRKKLRLNSSKLDKGHVCSEVREGVSRCECGKTW